MLLSDSGNFISKVKELHSLSVDQCFKANKKIIITCMSFMTFTRFRVHCLIPVQHIKIVFSLTMHRWHRKEKSFQVAHTALESSLNRQCIYHWRSRPMILKLSMQAYRVRSEI